MKLPTLEALPVAGKRVLVRADLNVPLADGPDGKEVADDTRLRASLPTIRALIDRRATVIVCSHLGRPKGERNPRYSLAPVAVALSKLLRMKVRLTSTPTGPADELDGLGPDEIGLLENLRYDPGEEANDKRFARGHSPVHGRPDRVDGHRRELVLVDLRLEVDDGHRRPARESRRLVRQRVGLLQQADRARSARPLASCG